MLIGYYFHAADQWGRQATAVFDDAEQNYTGSTVWEECFGDGQGGRCSTIQASIVREFRRVNARLKSAATVDELIPALSEYRIAGIVLDLVYACGRDAGEAARKIKDVQRAYENRCRVRMQRIWDRSLLRVHHRRDPCAALYCLLEPVVKDRDDIEVLLDAHDLASCVTPLFFYTGDYQDIVANREFILRHAVFNDIRYLNS